MNRRNFVFQSCIACITGVSISSVLSSCSHTILNLPIDTDRISLPLFYFDKKANKGNQPNQYIVVHNEKLKFPICVFRLDESQFTAIWMECSHQGTQLQVYGDVLQCPAHGSEFSNKGSVLSTPATKNLKTFRTESINNHLVIFLTK